MSTHLTITLSRSQARWDSNTWALSLRSDFSPRITAPYVGVKPQGKVMGKFRDLIKDFFTPDSAEVNIGFVKAKYSDNSVKEIGKLLDRFRGKRVLFANIDHEIWEAVFKSLHEIRDLLVSSNSELRTGSGKEVKPAVDFLIDVVSAYLAEYEAVYTRFMTGPSYSNMAIAHKERNWPELGEAAEDLESLRTLIFKALQKLSAFVGGQDTSDFDIPTHSPAKFWASYAQNRKFCETCGFNMYYAYNDICPSCNPDKVPDFLRDDYGRA